MSNSTAGVCFTVWNLAVPSLFQDIIRKYVRNLHGQKWFHIVFLLSFFTTLWVGCSNLIECPKWWSHPLTNSIALLVRRWWFHHGPMGFFPHPWFHPLNPLYYSPYSSTIIGWFLENLIIDCWMKMFVIIELPIKSHD